jgi:hypothetical protein
LCDSIGWQGRCTFGPDRKNINRRTEIKSEQAERLLKVIADGMEEGKEFVVGQAPDVVQELILWGRVTSVCWVSLMLLLAAVCFLVFRWFKRRWDGLPEKERWQSANTYSSSLYPHDYGVGWVVALSVGWVWVLTAVIMAIESLQVWLAPKVYVVEYLADVVK